jgi:hypothetical protein
MAALDDYDKRRVREHMGYPNTLNITAVYQGVTFQYDYATQLELAMNNIDAEAIPRVQTVLNHMDVIEAQKIDALQRMQVLKADVVTINPQEQQDLDGQYRYWQKRLGNLLNARPNPNDLTNGPGINAKIVR